MIDSCILVKRNIKLFVGGFREAARSSEREEPLNTFRNLSSKRKSSGSPISLRGGFRHCGARGQRPLEALDVTIFDVIYTVFCIFFSFAGPFLVKKSARPGAMAPLAPT